MDPVTLGLQAATTFMGMSAANAEGRAAQQAAQFQANTQYATGTREASEATREADIVASNARAAMASSGGSASDAGAIETLSKIKQEGEYNSQSKMYEAETNADITLYEGALAKTAAKNKAIGTALSGASSVYKTYSSADNLARRTTFENKYFK